MTTRPKHLRPRWRYLAVGLESWPTLQLTRAAWKRAVERATVQLLGDSGAAKLHLRLYGFSFADGYGEAVIRVRRGQEPPARAAIACCTTVNREPLRVRIRGISGTVRGCEEKYLGRQPEETQESTVVFAGEERAAVTRGEVVDVATADTFVGATPLDFE